MVRALAKEILSLSRICACDELIFFSFSFVSVYSNVLCIMFYVSTNKISPCSLSALASHKRFCRTEDKHFASGRCSWWKQIYAEKRNAGRERKWNTQYVCVNFVFSGCVFSFRGMFSLCLLACWWCQWILITSKPKLGYGSCNIHRVYSCSHSRCNSGFNRVLFFSRQLSRVVSFHSLKSTGKSAMIH